MLLALNNDQSLVPRSHSGQTVSDKVWFWVLVRVAEDMCDCEWVGCHEPAAPDEAAVDESRAVRGLPARDEPVVFLVVHLREVAHDERW